MEANEEIKWYRSVLKELAEGVFHHGDRVDPSTDKTLAIPVENMEFKGLTHSQIAQLGLEWS